MPPKTAAITRLIAIPIARELVALFSFILLANVKEHAPLSARASVDHRVKVEARDEHVNRAADRGCVSRLVCAQHGHVVNGVQVPCGNTRNETKPPPEAKRGRATDRVKEGYGKTAS